MKYNINFSGYWIEDNISGIPITSGIYLVYRCILAEEGVTLKEILYIGQADNLYDCLNNHDNIELFRRECRKDEKVCFSVAEVPKDSIDIVENALIFAQKPRFNDNDTDKFQYETPVSLIIEGRCKLLKYTNFTIR